MTTINPHDILSDTENFAEFDGMPVRKGTIASFLKNIDLFEDSNATDAEKEAALAMMKELAPGIIASGLHKHATFKNKTIENILSDL